MANTSPIALTAGARLLDATEAAAHAIGARLCYGEPARQGDRAVIPVASVWTAGGLGFGNTPSAELLKDGAGGGGLLSARPVGYIEIAEGSARFRRIITMADVLQLVGAAAVSALAASAWRKRRL